MLIDHRKMCNFCQGTTFCKM